jgi:hypothetical protein
MRNNIKLASVAGAIAMITSVSAMAAEHPGFDKLGFVGDTNQIALPSYCGTTFTCSVVASGDGFKQVQVTPLDTQSLVTDSFILTMVGDNPDLPNSQGFSDQSFVKMTVCNGDCGDQQNQTGIAAEQVIDQTDASSQFTSNTTINTGWANDGLGVSSPTISIDQSLSDDNGTTATAGDDFATDFTYAALNDADGNRQSFMIDIGQKAGLEANGGNPGDIQTFALRERQGAFTADAGSVDIDTTNSISWQAGEDIKAIWVGQEVVLDQNGTPANPDDDTKSYFGYLSFENLDSGAYASASRFDSAGSAGSWAWDPAFNTDPNNALNDPCLADPSGATCQ